MDKKVKIKFNVLAVICIMIFCFALTPISLQNDTFYTIKIGEHILENGIDMSQDPFSFHEIPYTYPHWLYDVGIYLIYKVGGMLGIYISTIILSCILGLTIYYTNRKIVKNDLTSFVLTLGVMCILKAFIAARAQLVTFILFAITLYFIESFLETKKKRYAVGLIIIPIIIANVHLAVWPFYFILFLPYIAEYLITVVLDMHLIYKIMLKSITFKIKKLSKKTGNEEKIAKLELQSNALKERFNKYINNQEKRRKNPYKVKVERQDATKWLIVIAIICVFTGLLTPLGDTPYTYLLNTMKGNTTKSINEHLPMVLIQSKYTLAILAISLSVLIFTDTKIKLRDLFLLGGLTVLALMSRRQLSLLALIGVIPVNRLICSLFNKYDPQGTEQMIKHSVSWYGKAITVLVIVLCSIITFRPQARSKFVSESSYPVEATEFIKNNLDVQNIKLYNEYNYGSYLLYKDIPVFIDSRADLYTPEFNKDKNKDIFTDFINVSSINTYYETIFDKYNFTHIIIFKNAKLNLFLSRDENYKLLYNDDNFVIYERLNHKNNI